MMSKKINEMEELKGYQKDAMSKIKSLVSGEIEDEVSHF
jgi:hypothetical protein